MKTDAKFLNKILANQPNILLQDNTFSLAQNA